MTENWSLSLTNEKADAARFASWIEALSADADLSKKNAFYLRLFFDEVLGNLYGYGFADGRAHQIEVKVDCDRSYIRAEVTDDGALFDPTIIGRRARPKTADEVTVGGWGIELIRKIADDLEYERVAGWNVLRMRFRRHRDSIDA